ncbi:UNKNOWN [Stylonychia lemnae]|uniref:EF-hand domain-containing protein n=1 Tax=Stylonychia lemnae TaxID=5949 RepID=A0A078ALA7_STYLE|nr:UNKNOWN [Stylonychia lemnae]|eukprot:CDW81648.1 UNKNOWN [Stylonychia lemnae]
MGSLITTVQNSPIPEPNKKIISCILLQPYSFIVPIGKVRTLHKGFQMLCESFAINQKEFEQIFALDESVFALWDSDSNEQKIKSDVINIINSSLVLFEFFDFNDNNYLEEDDLQFLANTCIGASFKIFSIGGLGQSNYETNVQTQETNERMLKLIKESFPDGMRIHISDMLKWASGTQDIKEFFTVVEIMNQNNTVA